MGASQLLIEQLLAVLTDLGLRLLSAIAIVILGYWLAGTLRQALQKALHPNPRLDATLVSFAANFIYVAVLVLAVISALGRVGVETASLIAILGTAGLAVGLALQGSLSNFAAGILIVIFRPFRVGDFIEGGGATGFVSEIQFLTTVLRTYQNQRVIVPNSKLLQEKIVNHSSETGLRMDLKVVGDEEDLDRVRAVIADELAAQPLILRSPAPTIAIENFTSEGVEWAVYPWIQHPADYWPVYFAVMEALKRRFVQEGFRLSAQPEVTSLGRSTPTHEAPTPAVDPSIATSLMAATSPPPSPPPLTSA